MAWSQLKVKQRLEYFLKKLKAICKKARGFEQQKIIRTLKATPSSKTEELLSLVKDVSIEDLCCFTLLNALVNSDLEVIIENLSIIIDLNDKLKVYQTKKIPQLEAKILASKLVLTTSEDLMHNLEDIMNVGSKKKFTTQKRGEESDEDIIIADQEWQSDDALSDHEDKIKLPKRNNRRGQQARRLMWENRYGSEAKHILENKIKKRVDLKAEKKPKIDKSLHPSWQAKKSNSVGIVASAGTKIVFEDNETGNLKREKSKKTKAIKKSDEILHPSWEAKKREKEAMAVRMTSAKPIKIVFD